MKDEFEVIDMSLCPAPERRQRKAEQLEELIDYWNRKAHIAERHLWIYGPKLCEEHQILMKKRLYQMIKFINQTRRELRILQPPLSATTDVLI